jgi:hypothetical protein
MTPGDTAPWGIWALNAHVWTGHRTDTLGILLLDGAD